MKLFIINVLGLTICTLVLSFARSCQADDKAIIASLIERVSKMEKSLGQCRYRMEIFYNEIGHILTFNNNFKTITQDLSRMFVERLFAIYRSRCRMIKYLFPVVDLGYYFVLLFIVVSFESSYIL